MYQDSQYLDGATYILENGEHKGDRTGTGTIDVFGLKLSFHMDEGFPLLTTKKIHWKSVINELIWFINGDTNTRWLNDRGVRIWDEWADENGDLGPVYGAQWRSWSHNKVKNNTRLRRQSGLAAGVETVCIDQLQITLDKLKDNPDCRRNIVSAWNVGEIEDMALPPCHLLFQWNVREGKYLDCQLYQRSCDWFLGVPFNIASYSALIHIMARCSGLEPGTLHWVGGSCHIYQNLVEQMELQLSRPVRPSPTLRITDDAPTTLEGWDESHFVIEGYDPHPLIKGKVSV